MSLRRLWQPLLLSLFLGIVSLWLASPRLFAAPVARSLSQARISLLLIAGLAILGWWFLSGFRTAWLARCTGSRLSLFQGLQTHVVGVFASAVTPAGGGNTVGIVLMLVRFGLPANRAASVAVMSMVGDMAFFGWSVPCAFVLMERLGVTLPLENLGRVVLTAAGLSLLASLLLLFRLDLATRVLRTVFQLRVLHRFRGRTRVFLYELEVTSRLFAQQPWHWHLRYHLLSSASRLCFFAVLNILLLALGVAISHASVLSIQIIVHMFAVIVPTPGASGYQEAAITFALKDQIGTAALAAAVILWRLANYYLYFVAGPLAGGLALILAQKGPGPGDAPEPPGEREQASAKTASAVGTDTPAGNPGPKRRRRPGTWVD